MKILNEVIGSIIIAFFAFAVIVFAVILGTLFGALSGEIVSWFFEDTINQVIIALGIEPIPLWKLGAFLGFVSGFFKTTINKKD